LLTDASGTISDGPGDYENNADCTWLIAPTGATSVSITFDEFDMEVPYDIVRVYKCATIECESKTFLGELAGLYPLPPTFQSNTGFIQVHFTSDESGAAPGFTASWIPTTSTV
jgi:hypothetical protein